MKIRRDFIGDGLFRDRHGCILHFLMAFIHWEFLVNFDEFSRFIINFLPETHGVFICIHFLQITRQPNRPVTSK
jgi:hypothetical protein